MEAPELFHFFDQDSDGKIGFEDAHYLPLLGVSADILRVAWDCSDVGRKGFLSNEEFGVLSRLVSVVQDGGSIDHQTPQTAWFQRFPPFFFFLFVSFLFFVFFFFFLFFFSSECTSRYTQAAKIPNPNALTNL